MLARYISSISCLQMNRSHFNLENITKKTLVSGNPNSLTSQFWSNLKLRQFEVMYHGTLSPWYGGGKKQTALNWSELNFFHMFLHMWKHGPEEINK